MLPIPSLLQIQLELLQLVEIEAAKEYEAPWLKNANTVVRDSSGRFGSKSSSNPVKTGVENVGEKFDRAIAQIGESLQAVQEQVAKLPQSVKAKVGALMGSQPFDKIGNELGQKIGETSKEAQASFDKNYKKLAKGISIKTPIDKTIEKTKILVGGLLDRVKRDVAPPNVGKVGGAAALAGAGAIIAAGAISGGLMTGAAIAIGGAMLDVGTRVAAREKNDAIENIINGVKNIHKQNPNYGVITPNYKHYGKIQMALAGAVGNVVGFFEAEPQEVKDWVEKDNLGSLSLMSLGVGSAVIGGITLGSIGNDLIREALENEGIDLSEIEIPQTLTAPEEVEAALFYAAPWYKSPGKVWRDSQGRFAKKEGGDSGEAEAETETEAETEAEVPERNQLVKQAMDKIDSMSESTQKKMSAALTELGRGTRNLIAAQGSEEAVQAYDEMMAKIEGIKHKAGESYEELSEKINELDPEHRPTLKERLKNTQKAIGDLAKKKGLESSIVLGACVAAGVVAGPLGVLATGSTIGSMQMFTVPNAQQRGGEWRGDKFLHEEKANEKKAFQYAGEYLKGATSNLLYNAATVASIAAGSALAIDIWRQTKDGGDYNVEDSFLKWSDVQQAIEYSAEHDFDPKEMASDLFNQAKDSASEAASDATSKAGKAVRKQIIGF